MFDDVRRVAATMGRCALAVTGCVPLLLAFGSGASARPIQASSMPSVDAARTIVSGLWAQRETALSRLDAASIPPLEMASARQQDVAYINGVRCRCEQMKGDHPMTEVIPQVPRASVQPVFFAQVHTTNVESGTHPWYLVAVERDAGGTWKLAFIDLGGEQSSPPLAALARSAGTALSVTNQTRARMAQLTRNAVHHAMTHNKLVFATSYGATIHRHAELRPDADGVFGFPLPSGDVLTCFTLHTIDVFSMPNGYLQQGPTQSEWGHNLAPGDYRSITYDTASPRCVVGKGADTAPGVLRFSYEDRIVGTKGVPA